MIAPNTIVGGRYRVMKPLGGGGMKVVCHSRFERSKVIRSTARTFPFIRLGNDPRFSVRELPGKNSRRATNAQQVICR